MTEQELGYLIGFSVWVLGYILVRVFCPVLKLTKDLPEGVTARNTVFRIKAYPEQENLHGVIAQEYYESTFKHNLINLFKLFIGNEDKEREMEILGHEITVQFYPPEEQHLKRLQHANALVKYYPCFKQWNIDTVYEWMTEETDFARDWIVDNIDKVNTLIEKNL